MAEKWSLCVHGSVTQPSELWWTRECEELDPSPIQRGGYGFRYSEKVPHGYRSRRTFRIAFPTLTKIENEPVTLDYIAVLVSGARGAGITKLKCYGGTASAEKSFGEPRGAGIVRLPVGKRVNRPVALEIDVLLEESPGQHSLIDIAVASLEFSE
jgi:hypothetical protein